MIQDVLIGLGIAILIFMVVYVMFSGKSRKR